MDSSFFSTSRIWDILSLSRSLSISYTLFFFSLSLYLFLSFSISPSLNPSLLLSLSLSLSLSSNFSFSLSLPHHPSIYPSIYPSWFLSPPLSYYAFPIFDLKVWRRFEDYGITIHQTQVRNKELETLKKRHRRRGRSGSGSGSESSMWSSWRVIGMSSYISVIVNHLEITESSCSVM